MVPTAARTRPAGRSGAKKSRSGDLAAGRNQVCHALAECVAFFRASRFRDVAPGDCREEDRKAAEAMIRATLSKLRKPRS
jgi:hypothetical protein